MPSASWANGWVTGDVVTAAEYRKSMGSIFDTTLGAAAANIDITGIVATYAHLRVELYARGDTAAGNIGLLLRINNDSATNYQWQESWSSAAVLTAAEGLAATSITLGNIPAATAVSGMFGSCVLDIPNYANASNMKAVDALVGYRTGTGSATGFSFRCSGWWNSAAAINRVTLLPATGNFIAGTRCTIYAMGA